MRYGGGRRFTEATQNLAPEQRISIDQHCDNKQVSFKEASEVEVLEPNLEPWEQKENELAGLGAYKDDFDDKRSKSKTF